MDELISGLRMEFNQKGFLLQSRFVTINQFDHATDSGQVRASELSEHRLIIAFLQQVSF
jgi:hypothetical protein